MRRIANLAIVFFIASSLSACITIPRSPDKAPVNLASYVDLQRFAGKWYIIANVPYFAEKGKVASYFDIQITDKKLLDVYYGKDSFDKPYGTFTMDDYVVPGTGNAVWRESPLWPFYFSYLIVYVDPDYKTALVGYPGHAYAWVMSREPKMDDATYQSLLARFAAAGYDSSKLMKVPQFPEQAGQPGFQ
jgi:apolipoprotein D and lipocalin family protein